MKTSESIKNIAKSLLKAQKEMGGATKGASNPYFKSKYADYGSVLEACKELFNDNGILITQSQEYREGKNFVLTNLLHAETGEWIESQTEIVCSKQNDPQALGSAITYARRYGLQSILAMPAEDDDGEKAMGRTAQTGYAKTTTTKADGPATTVTKSSTTTSNSNTTVVAGVTTATTQAAKHEPTIVTSPAVNGAAKKPSFKDKVSATKKVVTPNTGGF